MSNYRAMRKAHNRIKFDMIRKSVEVYKQNNPRNYIKVFDVSVGRFGDMHSYMKSGIDRIVGIDPDEASIIEGNSRLETNFPEHDTELCVDTITNKNIIITEFFDIVVCNFTLHYFFETESKLNNALSNISKRLKSGGYFIGTALDGSYISDTDTPFIKIKSTNTNETFGDGYTFELIDKPNSGNYFVVSRNTEYRTNRDIFALYCEKYGLEFVSYRDFPDFPGITRTDFKDHEKTVHGLYFTFVFYKI